MVTTLRPSTVAAERVKRSPPSFELSKPEPAILSPLDARASPPESRSRVAYTAHWPVYSSKAGIEGVDDVPLVDLRVGAVGRQDGAVELVEEAAGPL